MGSEWFGCARSSKEPSNYLSRISYSRIRGQVTIGFHGFFLQRNHFHRMVSLGHPLIPALCACRVCAFVCACVCGVGVFILYVLAHMLACVDTSLYVYRAPALLSVRCVKEIVSFHFPHITLHDFPHLCSHPRQLSPTLLRFPGYLAITCLL